MRADRLVSILMLLQRHKRMTALELARTLEVSVRTISRDMEALSTAGFPVYAERGVTGGYCLVENFRTELTGLTEDEARALFLLASPGPLDALEVGRKLKAALRKLYAVLPEYPQGAPQVQPRIHLDWTGWEAKQAASGHLEALYRATQHNQLIRLTYRMINGVEIEQVVQPLGLVTKAGVWHLVSAANGKIRSQRVSDLQMVELLPEQFLYPQSFDLRAYWETFCAEAGACSGQFQTLVRAAPSALAPLSRQFGSSPQTQAGIQDAQGWFCLELSFESFEAARQSLLGLGSAVEVLEPEPLRISMIDYAHQIIARYRSLPGV